MGCVTSSPKCTIHLKMTLINVLKEEVNSIRTFHCFKKAMFMKFGFILEFQSLDTQFKLNFFDISLCNKMGLFYQKCNFHFLVYLKSPKSLVFKQHIKGNEQWVCNTFSNNWPFYWSVYQLVDNTNM